MLGIRKNIYLCNHGVQHCFVRQNTCMIWRSLEFELWRQLLDIYLNPLTSAWDPFILSGSKNFLQWSYVAHKISVCYRTWVEHFADMIAFYFTATISVRIWFALWWNEVEISYTCIKKRCGIKTEDEKKICFCCAR